MTVRVRIAPSPTGFLHVGTARAALYNWLFARGRGGTFIVRSDDTDVERSSYEYHTDIVEGLRWLGLDWDEGVGVDGPHGSYRQSDRYERYRSVVRDMVERGLAYYSFVTAEQLDGLRKEAKLEGQTPAYDGRYRVDAEEGERRVANGEPAPVRFAVPRPGSTAFSDVVRGEVRFDHAQLDDFVVLRSDGSPTYHLASTVDDVDYEVTHVIRGEDILSSTPKHILLTEAMGATLPRYAHLSLLMGPDGKKLSKRQGHTALSSYRSEGFLPAAMLNYLALLGWSPGEEETVVSLEDMIARFDLEAVTKNPAVFDNQKLEWMNGVYIRGLSQSDFVATIRPLVEEELGWTLSTEELNRLVLIAPHVQDRVKRLSDVAQQVAFLFRGVSCDEALWDKVMAKPESSRAMVGAVKVLDQLASWDVDSIEVALRACLEELELSPRKGFEPLRVALSGSTVSPPLFESIEALGRERTIERLQVGVRRAEGLSAD